MDSTHARPALGGENNENGIYKKDGKAIIVYNNVLITLSYSQLKALIRYVEDRLKNIHRTDDNDQGNILLQLPESKVQLRFNISQFKNFQNLITAVDPKTAVPTLTKNNETISQQTVARRRKIAEQAEEILNTYGLKKEYTLISLANEIGTNETTLKQAFKKYIGTTVHQYILHHKMRYAITLINTDTPLVEISAAIGYSNMSYFSRAFKVVYGISPSKYK